MTTRLAADARLQHVSADIEASYPEWNPNVVHNKSDSHFWSVAADKQGERVMYTDIRRVIYSI